MLPFVEMFHSHQVPVLGLRFLLCVLRVACHWTSEALPDPPHCGLQGTYELLTTHPQDWWGFWEAHLPGDPYIHRFFFLSGATMVWRCLCESFCFPGHEIWGLLNLYSKIYLELHHLLVLISLQGLISACLALFLDYLSPTQCLPHRSHEILNKFGWEGWSKWWTLFFSHRLDQALFFGDSKT